MASYELFKMSCGKEAVHRMKERYQPLADNENTTLWEDFSELGTRNHAWSGGPLTILAKYIAGIEPVSPGYETYKVMPGLELADLSSLHIKVPTVKGDISVTVSKSPEKYKLSISSPAGCTATVGIPVNVSHDKRVSKVLSGRHLLWDKHKNVSDIKGITYLECNGKYIVFNIEPGNWELTGL